MIYQTNGRDCKRADILMWSQRPPAQPKEVRYDSIYY